MQQTERRVGIDYLELKQLLVGVRDNPVLGICFRYRLAGEMWYPNFTKVVMLFGNRVLLQDTISGALVVVSHLLDVVQFEIDGRFQHYQPNNHYSIRALRCPE